MTADAGAGLPQPLTGPGLRVARGRVTPGASHDVTVHSSKHHHDIKTDRMWDLLLLYVKLDTTPDGIPKTSRLCGNLRDSCLYETLA